MPAVRRVAAQQRLRRRRSTCSYTSLFRWVLGSRRLRRHHRSGCGLRVVPLHYLENRDRFGLAFDYDVAERLQIVTARQLFPGRLADDNPSAIVLVQRFEARAEVHRVADDGIAHDLLGTDVAGDHRTAVDADADVE